jgi:hypothetical protein
MAAWRVAHSIRHPPFPSIDNPRRHYGRPIRSPHPRTYESTIGERHTPSTLLCRATKSYYERERRIIHGIAISFNVRDARFIGVNPTVANIDITETTTDGLWASSPFVLYSILIIFSSCVSAHWPMRRRMVSCLTNSPPHHRCHRLFLHSLRSQSDSDSRRVPSWRSSRC